MINGCRVIVDDHSLGLGRAAIAGLVMRDSQQHRIRPALHNWWAGVAKLPKALPHPFRCTLSSIDQSIGSDQRLQYLGDIHANANIVNYITRLQEGEQVAIVENELLIGIVQFDPVLHIVETFDQPLMTGFRQPPLGHDTATAAIAGKFAIVVENRVESAISTPPATLAHATVDAVGAQQRRHV